MSRRFRNTKRSLERINELVSRYRNIFEDSLIGVFISQNKRLVYVNKYFESCFGYTARELYDMDWRRIISKDHHSKVIEIVQRLHSSNHEIFYDIKGVRKNGSDIYIQGNAKTVFYNGAPSVLGVFLNVTNHRKTEDKIREMALIDPVTGIPNRHFLKLHINYLLKTLKNQDKKIALLFIDLDRFKVINDTMGHDFGDIALKNISNRIMDNFKEGDILFRFAGDEFVAILENCSRDRAEKMAKDIIKSLSNSIAIDENIINITPSIGISLYPSDGNDMDTLIKYADIAMYEAKYQGRNNYMFYNKQMSIRVEENMKIEAALRKAVQNNELTICYQPIIEISTGKICAAEALLRWNSSELGMMMPDEFIHIAENTGLIVPIGEWVLRTACSQYKAWKKSGVHLENILVNISYKQLKSEGFTESLMRIINECGMNRQNVELELTESIFKDGEVLKTVLHQLHSNGFKISVDDFGVGYSSLSMLKHISINNLKIDRSFIREMLFDDKVSQLVKGIINIGKDLEYSVVAEGIETKEQFDFIKKHDCDYAQGYFFSKPVDAREFELFYKAWNPIG